MAWDAPPSNLNNAPKFSGKTLRSADGRVNVCRLGESFRRFLFAGLGVAIGAVSIAPVSAQTFETLYSFTSSQDKTFHPLTSPLIVGDSLLYGTASSLRSPIGAIFAVSKDGAGMVASPIPSNSGFPNQGFPVGLVGDESRLYSSVGAGNSPSALVYSFDLSAGYHVIHSYPTGTATGLGLTKLGSQLYGTTPYLDAPYKVPAYEGEVLAMNVDGSNYHVVRAFAFPEGFPFGSLLQSGSTLYGLTRGSSETIYSMNLDGSNFHVLHEFFSGAGADVSGLTLVGSVLYGTTSQGGPMNHDGTIFSVNVDGTNYQLLHTFTGPDGAHPNVGLTLLGGKLYGTADNRNGQDGGTNGGTIFSIDPNGSNFQVLYAFSGFNAGPGALVADGNTLYGTTTFGGTAQSGSVFAFSVPEPASGFLALAGVVACGVAKLLSRRSVFRTIT